MSDLEKARALIHEFKGEAYLFGDDVLSRIGPWLQGAGKKAVLVRGGFAGSDACVQAIRESLAGAGIDPVAEIKGARPNSPVEDVVRMAEQLGQVDADLLISFGGGSVIDAVKAADVLRVLGGDITDYFGTRVVSRALRRQGAALMDHVAIQTVAGSGAHLTKYSNITDLATGQKKLIVDPAVIPARAAFDYPVTHSVPAGLTADGALDGLSHLLEVLYGAVGKPHYDKAAQIAEVGMALVIEHLPRAMNDLHDRQAREALCLATDLGGYAIMIGGTNGGHLTSFSLVDILPHGRACAIMNPYYTVFFAPAIEAPLRLVGRLYRQAGLTDAKIERLAGRELGLAVAEAMLALARAVGFPTTLSEVEGFHRGHIERALNAAKDLQLRMKLQNMPVPLTAETVDDCMGPVLEAAVEGDLSLIGGTL